MDFYLHVAISILAVSFAQFFIGSSKLVPLQSLFLYFFARRLFYINNFLIIQINPMNKNLTNLGLNPGHMVRLVPDWVDCCMAYDLL